MSARTTIKTEDATMYVWKSDKGWTATVKDSSYSTTHIPLHITLKLIFRFEVKKQDMTKNQMEECGKGQHSFVRPACVGPPPSPSDDP